MEVLSARQAFKEDNEGKPIVVQVINLLVNPEPAEQLSLAASQTQIQLVLRNPLDHETTKTPGTAMAQLFTGQRIALGDSAAPVARQRPTIAHALPPVAQAAPAPKKEAPFVMEIISGTKKTELKFDNKEPVEGK